MSDLASTERADPATATIDTLGSYDLVTALVGAHARAVEAALAAAQALATAVDAVAAVMATGGRLFIFGAGTSGRLAVLDAAELPPTFGIDPASARGVIAGGEPALRAAIEGAEDDGAAGARAAVDVTGADVAIGISASGGSPFVLAALAAASARGARTIGIANSPGSAVLRAAQIAIVLETGAEPIAGSTRLVAGTAQKIALNTISTGAMIRLGKTYGNRMIDVVATNAKLRARAQRLLAELTADTAPAELLERAGGRVKTAVVMSRLDCDRSSAEAALRTVGGRLGALIGPG